MPSFRFRSKEQDTIETIREKLAKAQAEVAAAEERLRQGSLEAALSDDPEVGREAMLKLRQARETVELFQSALTVAEEREQQRLAKARADLRASQNRAIRQYISSLVKDALAYQVAIDNQVAAWRRMVRAGEQIIKQLPRDGVTDRSGFANAVSPTELKNKCRAYAGRHAARPGIESDERPDPPGCHPMPVPVDHGDSIRNWPPLADRLRTELLRQFERLTGRAAPPAPDPSRPDAMVPQPEPPPASILVLSAEMIDVHGEAAMRQLAIRQGLEKALADREAAPIPVEPTEPEPDHAPIHVDEPDEEPRAQVMQPTVATRRGLRGAVAALGLGG
jgi:hypothetical protein